MRLLPPPPGHWYISFFFLAGPDHLREIAVSAFSRSLSRRANTFSFLSLPSTPRIYMSGCFSDTVLSRSESLSLRSILSPTCALYVPNFPTARASSWFPPISFHTFSTTLTYLFQLPLWLFSPILLYQLWLAASFFGCSLLYFSISIFPRLYFS